MTESILPIIFILILLILLLTKDQQVNKLKGLLRQALDDGDKLIKLVNTYRKDQKEIDGHSTE